MGYYNDAEEWHGTAIDMESCGRYRGAVYMSCLAVECFLKSKVEIIEPMVRTVAKMLVTAGLRRIKSSRVFIFGEVLA